MKEICPNLRNKQVAKEFGELEQLFGKTAASLLWSRNNGYSIDKAPNGADSILFRELLHITNGDRIQALILKAKVYSDEFFKWFGNWEKAAKENPYSKDISIGSPEADFSNVDSTGTGVLIPIFLNGEYIGETGLDNALYHKDKGMSIKGKYMEMPSVGGSNITIEKEYRGKGYGKATYFELAKLAANNGKILRSAPDKSRTPASTRVWESLVRDGYAKRVNDRYEIINSTLNNASKVVDENGEPLVVYHNTPFEFNGIFDMDHKSRIMPWTSEPFGHVGTQETANKIKGTQFALFLNIRNPLETPDFVHETVNSMLSELYKQGIISKDKYSSLRGISNSELRDLMLSLGYDGTKYENKAEKGGTSYSFISPNQIKSATDNIGTFSRTNNDIYDTISKLISEKDASVNQTSPETITPTETKEVEVKEVTVADNNEPTVDLNTGLNIGKVRDRRKKKPGTKVNPKPTRLIPSRLTWGVWEGFTNEDNEPIDVEMTLKDLSKFYTEEQWNQLSDEEMEHELKCKGVFNM